MYVLLLFLLLVQVVWNQGHTRKGCYSETRLIWYTLGAGHTCIVVMPTFKTLMVISLCYTFILCLNLSKFIQNYNILYMTAHQMVFNLEVEEWRCISYAFLGSTSRLPSAATPVSLTRESSRLLPAVHGQVRSGHSGVEVATAWRGTHNTSSTKLVWFHYRYLLAVLWTLKKYLCWLATIALVFF